MQKQDLVGVYWRALVIILNAEPVPPVTSPSDEDERVSDMLERVGVSSEKCACDNRETKENRKVPSIRRKERKKTVTHTFLHSYLKHNINRKTHDTCDFGLIGLHPVKKNRGSS